MKYLRYLSVLSALFLTQCNDDYSGYLPPSEYDHEYDGFLQLEIVSPESVKFWCGQQAIACSMAFDKTCVVYLPDKSTIPRDILMRHELGHCNGWEPNHPR